MWRFWLWINKFCHWGLWCLLDYRWRWLLINRWRCLLEYWWWWWWWRLVNDRWWWWCLIDYNWISWSGSEQVKDGFDEQTFRNATLFDWVCRIGFGLVSGAFVRSGNSLEIVVGFGVAMRVWVRVGNRVSPVGRIVIRTVRLEVIWGLLRLLCSRFFFAYTDYQLK